MEFSGTVIEFIDKAGTYKNGDKAGQPFKSAHIVVQDSETSQYPETAVFKLFGEKVNYPAVGDEVMVEFNMKAEDYNGKWYNKLKGWRVNVISGATGSAPSAYDTATATAYPDPLAASGQSDNSDLPF